MLIMKYIENEVSKDDLELICSLQVECNKYDSTKVDYTKYIAKNSIKIKIVKKSLLLGFVEINKGVFDNESTVWMVLHPSIRTSNYIEDIMRMVHIECDKLNIKRRKFIVEAKNEYIIKLISNSKFNLLYSTYEMKLEVANLNSTIRKVNNIVVSELEKKDFEEIANICSAAFNTTVEDELDYLSSILKSKSKTVYVSKLDTNIVGTVSIDISDSVNIADLVVKESERGKGIGKDILGHIISEILADKYETFKLSVETANDKALVMYKEIGFIIDNKFNCYNLINNLSL